MAYRECGRTHTCGHHLHVGGLPPRAWSFPADKPWDWGGGKFGLSYRRTRCAKLHMFCL